MGKGINLLLFISVATMGFSEDSYEEEEERCCKSTSYVSRDTTTLSMMGWGIGLFAAIAVLTSLLGNNPDSDTTETTP